MTTTNCALNQIAFLEKFGTMRGRQLASKLGLAGKDSEKLANSVSGFFWNYNASIVCDKVNEMKAEKAPNVYIDICNLIYEDGIICSSQYHWLPAWVRTDIEKAVKMLNMRR